MPMKHERNRDQNDPLRIKEDLETIRRGIEVRWGLTVSENSHQWTAANPHQCSIPENVNALLGFLYFKKRKALDDALEKFACEAPKIIGWWRFKPEAELGVTPPVRHEDSKLYEAFQSQKNRLSKDQIDALMRLLCSQLKIEAEKVKIDIEQSTKIVKSKDNDRATGSEQHRTVVGHQPAKNCMAIKDEKLFEDALDPNESSEACMDSSDETGFDLNVNDSFSLENELDKLAMTNEPSSACVGPNRSAYHRTATLKLEGDFDDDLVLFDPSHAHAAHAAYSRSVARSKNPRSSCGAVEFEDKNAQYSFPTDPSIIYDNDSDDDETHKALDFENEGNSAESMISRASSFASCVSPDASVSSNEFAALRELSSQTNDDLWTLSNEPEGFELRERCKQLEQFAMSTEPYSLQEKLVERMRSHPPFVKISPNFLKRSFRQVYEIARISESTGVDFECFKPLMARDVDDYTMFWDRASEIVNDKSPQAQMPPASSPLAWKKAEGKFGGVTLSGRLQFCPSAEQRLMKFELRPLTIDRSYRLARKFGGDRFLIVQFPQLGPMELSQPLRIDPDATRHAIIEWLIGAPHEILGRSWRAFFVKQDRPRRKRSRLNRERCGLFVYFFDTRATGDADSEENLQAMLEWFLPTHKNQDQAALKLFSRMQLGVSRTIPTINIRPMDIQHVKDTVPGSRLRRSLAFADDLRCLDAMTSTVMNDGCARLSLAAARQVVKKLDISFLPCAFQGRISGAKGMWLVEYEEKADEVWIEISRSQTKFQPHSIDGYAPDVERTTFEINDYARPLCSSSISFQLIPLLIDRGVSGTALESILVDNALRAEEDLRLAVASPLAMRLWIQKNYSVMSERLASDQVAMLGGIPASRAERIIWLLESGFQPKLCKHLGELCRDIIQMKVLDSQDKTEIAVSLSAYPFMLPDPLGVLEEGEVHLCFSEPFIDRPSGFEDIMLDGMDVLVARSPAHLPSDVQKVRACFKKELRRYTNVLVCSVQGTVPLASKLSGGDYDGDRALVIWDEKLVRPFTNYSVAEIPRPSYYGMDVDMAKTSDFMQDGKLTMEFLRHGFRHNFRMSMLGPCSVYHEYLCYWHASSQNSEAMLVAGLLSHLVDSGKQGLVFDEKKWAEFKEWNKLPKALRKPAYKEQAITKEPSHILDRIVFILSQRTRVRLESIWTELCQDISRQDPDLIHVYLSERRASRSDLLLKIVLDNASIDLDEVYDFWRTAMAKDVQSSFGTKSDSSFASTCQLDLDSAAAECRRLFLAIAPRVPSRPGSKNDRIVEWQSACAENRPSYWNLLKASMSFYKFSDRNFVWYANGIELGQLKIAQVSGTPRSIIPEIYLALKLDGRIIRRLEHREDTHSHNDDSEDEFGNFSWTEDLE